MSTSARFLVVTDLETTGTNAAKHEIIQVARVLVDLTVPKVMPETLWSTYVKPGFRWGFRDQEAMEVNKLTREFLEANGIGLLDTMVGYSTGVPWNTTLLAAWGSDFEKSFLKEAFARCSRACPINYRVECVRSWAHLWALAGGYSELPNLGEACQLAGIEFDRDLAHNAEYDTMKTALLAVYLIEELRWNRP